MNKFLREYIEEGVLGVAALYLATCAILIGLVVLGFGAVLWIVKALFF